MFRKNEIVVVNESHQEEWLHGCVLRLTDVLPIYHWCYYGVCIESHHRRQFVGSIYKFPPSALSLRKEGET